MIGTQITLNDTILHYYKDGIVEKNAMKHRE